MVDPVVARNLAREARIEALLRPPLPRRKWSVGDRVGGWEVTRLGSHCKGLCRCLSCGVERTINYSALASFVRRGVRLGAGCASCSAKARRKPKFCRSCGTTDRKRFSRKATECSACNRRACRNGRDAEGRAIYRWPKGRQSKAEQRWSARGRGVPKLKPCGAPRPKAEGGGTCPNETHARNCSDRCRVRRADVKRRARGRR